MPRRSAHPMPVSQRAKIFAPFDALRGFSAALRAKERLRLYLPDDHNEDPNMCYRFYIHEENEEIREITKMALRSSLAEKFMVKLSKPLVTSGEVRPTDVVSVIATGMSLKKAVFPMKWGFTLPGSRQPLVNARSETAGTKPTFKDSWHSRRCIVPASWYFEWEHFKSPDGKIKTGSRYSIQPAGSDITWLCGLYRMENDYPVFTVLTREPSEELSALHDRMPLILPEELIDAWIKPETKPEELLPYALTDMVFEISRNS